jgi:hypothetical protein
MPTLDKKLIIVEYKSIYTAVDYLSMGLIISEKCCDNFCEGAICPVNSIQ